MSDLRTHKRRARRDVHRKMCVPVVVMSGQHRRESQARVHRDFQTAGNLRGISWHTAETAEESPRIIMLAEDVQCLGFPVTKGAVFSVLRGEAYRVEMVALTDDEFRGYDCVRLPRVEADLLPVPADV